MPFITANQLRLYYEWHGEAGGTPVVLVMGLGSDSSAWQFQVAALAPRCRVLVFDNRGVGQSEMPDVPYTTGAMAEDLLSLLDGLGGERAHLVGLSMGGAIAQEAVLASPERFASLQLHATWAGLHPYFQTLVAAVRRARGHFDPESFCRTLSLWLFTPVCFAAQPGLVELVVRWGIDHPVPLHAYLRQTEAVLAHDARDRLHEVPCPTLVTVGEQDLVTPPVLAEELVTLIPRARLVRLPGTGHGALWETPEAFNTACLDFLDTLT